MYYEHQVQRLAHYDGPLTSIPMDGVRGFLVEAFHATGVSSWCDFPLPPAGLPGKLHERYDEPQDADVLSALCLGMRYVEATVFNERRGMHNRWQEARDFIAKVKRDAIHEYVMSQCRRDDAVAPEQLVYFIGTESGPIKIGIAANPVARLQGLQTSHPEKLTIFATCEGGAGQERAYHKRFADRRLKGEWFERCPEIEAEIAGLAA